MKMDGMCIFVFLTNYKKTIAKKEQNIETNKRKYICAWNVLV